MKYFNISYNERGLSSWFTIKIEISERINNAPLKVHFC